MRVDPQRHRFIAAERSFHGRSLGALALTGKAAAREPFGPFGLDVTFVPYGDADALAAAVDDDTAAVFLEPTLVAAVGASGGFDSDLRPTTYRRALELVASGKIQVEPFVTHRYHALEDIHQAFEADFVRPEYIKGVLALK